MKTLKITVKGQIQRVGYRNVVSQIAFSSGVNGQIENLRGGNVRIIAQGKENDLREFIKQIKIHEWPINVNEIKTEPLNAGKVFRIFEIIRKKNELAERADVAVLYMQKLNNKLDTSNTNAVLYMQKLNSKLDTSNTKHDTGVNKLLKASNKVKIAINKTNDSINDSINNFSDKTVQHFEKLDTKYGSVSSTLQEMNGNLKDLTRVILMIVNKTAKN